MRRICQNDHSFRRGTDYKFITPWPTAEISTTLFALVTPRHHPTLSITSVVTNGPPLPTQRLTTPTNRHQHHQTFEAVCRPRCELLLYLGPLSFVFCLAMHVRPCPSHTCPERRMYTIQELSSGRKPCRPSFVRRALSVLRQPYRDIRLVCQDVTLAE